MASYIYHMKLVALLVLMLPLAQAQFQYRDPVTCEPQSCEAGTNQLFLTDVLGIDITNPYWYNSTADVDCVYTETDGPCDATCGEGHFQRTVTIITQAAGSGQPCPAEGVTSVACNLEACTPTPSACAQGLTEVFLSGSSSCIDETQYTNIVKVSGGGLSSPYYSFTDGDGNSVERLLPNTKYVFVRDIDPDTEQKYVSHPFFIDGAVSNKTTYAPGPNGGIVDSEAIFVTTGTEGDQLAWKCTNHASMAGLIPVSTEGTCSAQNKFYIPLKGCVACRSCPPGYKVAAACEETKDTVCQRDVTIADPGRQNRLNAAATRAQTIVTRMKRSKNVGVVDTMLAKIRDKAATVVRGIANRRAIEGSDLEGLTGGSDLRKMIIAEARVSAETETFDAEDVEIEMTKEDFKNAMDGLSNAKTHMDSRNVARVVMKSAKTKTTETCAEADIHLENINGDEFVEVLLLEQNDVSIKCLNNVLVSRVELIADEDDDANDLFQAQCWDVNANAWGVANNYRHDDSYTCAASGNYLHFVLSDAGGAISGCTDSGATNHNPDATVDDGSCEFTDNSRAPGETCADTVDCTGGETCTAGVCECIEVGQRVLMADGTHKNVEHLVPGDMLRTPDGTTTVRSTRRGGRHLSAVHDVECAGKTGAITGNHAYHCEGEWRLPQETHEPRALTGTTEVVAVETDNYCEDRMILEGGLHVETWDGRGIDEWRPHTYENGRRLRCTLKGTWRDRVLKRVDSKQ